MPLELWTGGAIVVWLRSACPSLSRWYALGLSLALVSRAGNYPAYFPSSAAMGSTAAGNYPDVVSMIATVLEVSRGRAAGVREPIKDAKLGKVTFAQSGSGP